MSAKVIEFEGIDGSGKTTAYNYLIAQLRAQGKRVLDTREVGNPHLPVCVALRKIVLDPSSKMDGMSMEFVFAAMRIENQKFYETVKDEYDFIVSDRGLLSHLAYTDHNVDELFTHVFYENLIMNYTKNPDLVIFLKIDPEVALKRRNSRNGFVDAIEAKGPEFQRKVYGSFVKYIDRLLEGAVNRSQGFISAYIDANGTIEEVQTQLNELVKSTPIYNWSNFS